MAALTARAAALEQNGCYRPKQGEAKKMTEKTTIQGANQPIAERLQDVMRRDGVDEREAAHRLLEEAGLPRRGSEGEPAVPLR